jgi:hypothetical protein
LNEYAWRHCKRGVKFTKKEIARLMKEPGSSEQIDPLLSPFLRAVDKEEEQESLQRLISQVEEVVRKTTSDSDEYHEAWRQLIVALRRCKADPENNPIRNFRHYAGSVAKHVRMKQRRDARLEFTALKEELRRLLHAAASFALWKASDGKQHCGLAEWAGQASSPARSERLAQLGADPLGCEDEVLGGRNAQQIKSEELVEAVFRWLDHPLKLDELTEIVFELKRILPFVVVPEPDADDDKPSPIETIPARGPLPDQEAETRELLKFLWAEIEQLPRYQRIALMLNFTLADGESEIFVFYGVAGVRRIGRTLELSDEHYARCWSRLPVDEEMPADDDEKFAALWKSLPLDDLTIAGMLDTTRQNVINLRSSALKRLRRRMANLR